jgi:MFS transporter, DHA3 family, macrolide efflux protein
MNKKSSFFLVWIGQVISLFGSGLTGFALGVWLYQRTGSASNFAFIALCTVLPQMLLSPAAGVLVDRINRRYVMALADGGAALSTLLAAGLFFSGRIEAWHIYLLTVLSASFGAFQAPAYAALVAGTVEREQLGRVNGMIQLGQALSDILAPALAGVLVIGLGVAGVLLIDLATFLIAVSTLLLSRLPALPPARQDVSALDAGWLNESLAGWRALARRPGLVALLRFQALFTFLWSLFAVLVSPLVLGFARADGLGIFLSVAGVGLLVGGLVMSAWGGPRRRLAGLLGFELASALAFVLMGLRPNLFLVAAGAFCAHFTLAFVSGLNDAIWQGQVPEETRGRVFAARQAVTRAVTLVAYLLAGGLADRWIEPLLYPGGMLAGSLGSIIGVGPGRGIALVCVLIGLVKAAAALGLFSSPLARELGAQIDPAPMEA